MAELFIELLVADLPARMQRQASDDFAKLILKALDDREIPYENGISHSTPRRLILFIDGLPVQTEDITEEKRGPRVDAPEQALQGFLKANGLDSTDQCTKKETPKGSFWFIETTKKGQDTGQALSEIIPESIRQIPWAKSMRWGKSAVRFARPLKGIVALFNDQTINGSFDLGNDAGQVTFSNQTVGHRFLAPDALTIKDWDDYKKKMHSAYVMISREERKAIVTEEAQIIANAQNLTILDDDALMEEIVGLVEWPVVRMGTFEQSFLQVPQECLISTMKKDQKYIPLFDQDGNLSNHFIITANMVTEDQEKQIIAGNEKVLRARLSDAEFFYTQDLKTPLASRTAQLDEITFHEKLGKVGGRVKRMETLAADIASELNADVNKAKTAASLCKSDLVSGMVGEFASLQGVAGRYYALAEGMDSDIAFAIEDHYKPQGPNDECPSTPVSIALALAEKIDILTGFFAIDEKPTGSKDPFALRRAALGIIRIVLENDLSIDLADLFNKAYDLYNLKDSENPTNELLSFMADRLKVSLKEKGVRYDMIDAVFALGQDGNLSRVVARAQALQNFLDTDDGSNLLAGYKRATNIVSIEEKKEGSRFNAEISSDLFTQDEEKKLYEILTATEKTIEPALASENFENVMAEMAKLRQPIDAFFEKVTVNDNNQDLRINRLNMLSKIRNTLNRVANFSCIEG